MFVVGNLISFYNFVNDSYVIWVSKTTIMKFKDHLENWQYLLPFIMIFAQI